MPPRNFVKGRSQSRWSWYHLQQCVCVDAWLLLGNSPCCCPLCLSLRASLYDPAIQWTGCVWVFCALLIYQFLSLGVPCLLSPSPFPLPCWLPLVPDPALPALPSRHCWQWGWGGFQENEGFTTGRSTFAFVLNSPAWSEFGKRDLGWAWMGFGAAWPSGRWQGVELEWSWRSQTILWGRHLTWRISANV